MHQDENTISDERDPMYDYYGTGQMSVPNYGYTMGYGYPLMGMAHHHYHHHYHHYHGYPHMEHPHMTQQQSVLINQSQMPPQMHHKKHHKH
ncbi:hypothetical protein [Metabacillus fastidiosus]|uniref:hypothetical protein n=1 Tax=Metabacillus fastidiosus TaxID=1458 RepID=UPI003D2B0B4C